MILAIAKEVASSYYDGSGGVPLQADNSIDAEFSHG